MSLSSLSIRRPVLASVMSIVIVLFGVISFFYLGVREYPSVDPPIVTVSTSYVGANADVIESQITEPLEESVNGIAGIRTLTSTSRQGQSTIWRSIWKRRRMMYVTGFRERREIYRRMLSRLRFEKQTLMPLRLYF